MAKIVLTEEDRAFVAQGLEDFDPERHPILSVELDKIEKELAKHVRDDVVEHMNREIRVALEGGVLLWSVARYLEEERLGWFMDAFMSEGWGHHHTGSEIRGQEQFNWAVHKLYGDADNALREAFAFVSYAAEARGIGDAERERKWLKDSTDPAKLDRGQTTEEMGTQ